MTKDKLLQIISEINALPVKDNEEETVYQELLINGDMVELTIFEDRFEIEYFALTGNGTYNSYTIVSNKFDNK